MSNPDGVPEIPDTPQDDSKITLDDNVEALNAKIAAEIHEELDAPVEIEVISVDSSESVEVAGEEPADSSEVSEASEPTNEADKPASVDPADKIASDPVIDKAVDEIRASDSDKLLDAEDEERERENQPAQKDKAETPIGVFLRKVWANPASRWGVIIGSFLLLCALAVIPNSRYFILNTAQVRASLEVTVIDNTTLQPLKNVTVRAAGAEAQTNSDGFAKLEKIKLGRTELSIEKRAFSPITRTLTIGWGSNKQGEQRVIAVGTQYTLYVRDFMSGKAIERAEAASGDGNASSDNEGKIILTLDTADQEDYSQLNIKISADGFRTETVNITVNNREAQSVDLVPARKHVFVTKRSGKYEVYSINVDGKNEERVVSGMGNERDDLALVPHPTKNLFAYVATRENTRNSSGYLLSTVYVVDMDNGNDIVKIDQSEQVQVLGWSEDDRLIYAKIAAGASGTDPKRHRIVSFNSNDYSDTKEIASANSFNEVLMAGNRVYFAPSNIFNEAESAVYMTKSDGSDKQKILDKEAFALVRVGHDRLAINADNTWYDYNLGSPQAGSGQAPSSRNGWLFTDSPNKQFSLWVDSRDGKGVLLNRNLSTGDDSLLVERGGLRLPVYWLRDNYIIYRVADGRETADYVLNLDGGEPRKITDVTDSAGLSRWYYF